MPSPLEQFAADHRYLLNLVARQAGFADPVAINLHVFHEPLMRHARKGEVLPIDGVLVRDWNPDHRAQPGLLLGMRLYEIEGIRFARACFPFTTTQNNG